jgi:hypothetical protein
VDNVFRVEKDMSIGHEEFWRLFRNIDPPLVMDAIGDQIGSQDFHFNWRGGEVRVQLSEEKVRQIASLCLPRTYVTLLFVDLSDVDIEYFNSQFDRRFQRAGG